MRTTRFPLRRSLRAIDEMQHDFAEWESHYRQLASEQWTLGDAAKYEHRAYILELAREHLENLFHDLEGMPRLS